MVRRECIKTDVAPTFAEDDVVALAPAREAAHAGGGVRVRRFQAPAAAAAQQLTGSTTEAPAGSRLLLWVFAPLGF